MATSTSPIAGSDFTLLTSPKRQANVLLFGDAGTGKSTFATAFAPEPVAFINFDRRADYAVTSAMAKNRRIYYTGIDIPANVTKLSDEAARKFGQAAVDKVIRNYELAIAESRKGNVRSICLDTITEYGELLKLAITGRIDKTKGDYGKSKDLINREIWRLFNLAREGNAHVIALSRAKAVWKDNEPTGRFTFRCPDVVNDAVDWAAHIRLKQTPKGKAKKEIEIEITKAGNNIEQLGEVYSEATWGGLGPFAYGCMLQYPGSELEDWQ